MYGLVYPGIGWLVFREESDMVTRDIADACATLDHKGGVSTVEKVQTETRTGY